MRTTHTIHPSRCNGHTRTLQQNRNVQYPKNSDGELAEVPIPEQWQHSLQGDWPSLKLRNEVSSLYH